MLGNNYIDFKLLNNMLKTIVKKIFNLAGYEIKRSNFITPDLHDQKLNPGVIVELIGPSGVGKTTLFKNIEKELRPQWVFKKDLAKINPLGIKGIGVEAPYYNVASLLIEERLKSSAASKRPPSISKLSSLNYCAKELANNIVYINKEIPNWLFSDDGIFHLFTSEIVTCEDKLVNDEEAKKFLFEKRVLVHLDAEEEYIVENLKKRHNELKRNTNDLFSRMSEEEVYDRTRSRRKVIKEVTEIYKKYGSIVCEINAMDGTEVNIKKLKVFLDEIVESNVK
ncbi:ATP-binding cassette domain-containing protein [Vreelandella sp. H-I2]